MLSFGRFDKLVRDVKNEINDLKCCGNCFANDKKECSYVAVKKYMKANNLDFDSHFVCCRWNPDHASAKKRLFLPDEVEAIGGDKK